VACFVVAAARSVPSRSRSTSTLLLALPTALSELTTTVHGRPTTARLVHRGTTAPHRPRRRHLESGGSDRLRPRVRTVRAHHEYPRPRQQHPHRAQPAPGASSSRDEARGRGAGSGVGKSEHGAARAQLGLQRGTTEDPEQWTLVRAGFLARSTGRGERVLEGAVLVTQGGRLAQQPGPSHLDRY